MGGDQNEIVVQAPHNRFKQISEIREPRKLKIRWFLKDTFRLMYNALYSVILGFFRSLNRKARVKIADWFMRCETLEHVDYLLRVFKWVVFPVSLLYVGVNLLVLKQNVLDSLFVGILIFFYSNFLPDLPSVFRRKVYYDVRDTMYEPLPWYKKCFILLFVPMLIVAFWCGIRLNWKTTETFHNLKSLVVYSLFLWVVSLLAFGGLSISIGDIPEIISIPFYGSLGYLSHLKVDLCI